MTLTPFRSKPTWRHEKPLSPPAGGVLVAANHQSFIDGPLLAFEFARWTGRPLRFIAYDEPFRNPIFRWILRSGGCLPFRRGNPRAMRDTLALARACLSIGQAVGIFPEGKVNDKPYLLHARPGLSILALLTGFPILPAGLRGSEQVLPARKKWPRLGRCAHVVWGEHLYFSDMSAEFNASDTAHSRRLELVQSVNHRIMAEIAVLSGKPIR